MNVARSSVQTSRQAECASPACVDQTRPLGWLLLTLLALCASSAAAGPNRWTAMGPAASVHALAIDPHNPNILHAVGREIVARSDDRGATWTVTPLPGLLEPAAIRVAPSLSSTIYAVGLSGVYRSTNGGISWAQVSSPKTAQFQNDLQVDTASASTITVAASNFCFLGCTGGGVFRSDNGGASWRAIGLKDVNIQNIALDPTTSQVVYAMSGATLYRTSNGGSSWKTISPPASGNVNGLVVDPILTTTLYAATEAGVFRSRDAGTSWELIRGSYYGSLIAPPSTGAKQLFVESSGMALSRDEGRTWLELGESAAGLPSGGLLQLAASGAIFYVVLETNGSNGQLFSYEYQPPRRRAGVK